MYETSGKVVVVVESMKALFYSFIVDSMHPILHGMAFKMYNNSLMVPPFAYNWVLRRTQSYDIANLMRWLRIDIDPDNDQLSNECNPAFVHI
jgi:hypothetical protein